METGELTAVELVDFYLARIAAYDEAGPTRLGRGKLGSEEVLTPQES